MKNTKVVQAITDSIRKWDNIIHHKGVDQGTLNCSLCRLYNPGSETCRSCPVVTVGRGERGCCNTPYQDWTLHHQQDHHNFNLPYRILSGCEECLRLARNERAFLARLALRYQEAHSRPWWRTLLNRISG